MDQKRLPLPPTAVMPYLDALSGNGRHCGVVGGNVDHHVGTKSPLFGRTKFDRNAQKASRLDRDVEVLLSDVKRLGDPYDLDVSLFVRVIPNDELHLTRAPALRRGKLETLVLESDVLRGFLFGSFAICRRSNDRRCCGIRRLRPNGRRHWRQLSVLIGRYVGRHGGDAPA